MKSVEPIICPLWIASDKRFRSRRYHAWDRPCHLCQRKVVVSDAIKRELEARIETVLICEQCALARSSEIEESLPASATIDPNDNCPICASFKEQAQEAMVELARVKDLTESKESVAIERKLEHLSKARWRHQFKSHNEDARGE